MSVYKGFTSVELSEAPKSTFDLSHEKRLTTRMGKLTPVFVSEAIPGDTFKMTTEVMLRFAPLLAPIYHMINVYVHYFFVPNRILATWWENFITGGRTGQFVTTPPVPTNFQINAVLAAGQNWFAIKSLADYFGIPPIPDADASNWTGRTIDVLPFAAYQKIWSDYYRDRNFIDDPTWLPMQSGTQSNFADLLTMRYRNWSHDYFNSSLPFTQRGAEVLMPMQGSGTVTYLPTSNVVSQTGSNFGANTVLGTAPIASTASLQASKAPSTGAGGINARIENIQNVSFTNTSITINDFRRAQALQRWLERNAIAGSRYNETIFAHFRIKTSDGRLQRAEYIGGLKTPAQISEIPTTAWSNSGSANVPPANMAGRGVAVGNAKSLYYKAEEWGFVIGIMSVMPTPAYMQGIPRMFLGRNTFLDYPWPTFAHLGEQPVYNYEIYADTTSVPASRPAQPIFGYQSRYSDWKFLPSTTHGDFRTTLDYWHLTRRFSSQPVLGAAFNQFEDALQDEIFAVAGTDTLWCYLYNKVTVRRSLPYFGTPSLA